MNREYDISFMKYAIKEAKRAYKKREVPVGAVIVIDNQIVAKAHNQRESKKSATAHAEILAIQKACKKIDAWRLENATLYVTLEPCPMCAGAIIQSRIKRVVFGSHDEKFGAVGSVFNLFYDYRFNHTVDFAGGILQEECVELMQSFFKDIRENSKNR